MIFFFSFSIATVDNTTIESLGRFLVKLPDDEKDCEIKQIDAIPDGKVIVIDANNHNIKVFDKDKNKLATYTFTLTSAAAMTVLNNDEVLVSVYIPENFDVITGFGITLDILNMHGNELSMAHTIPMKDVDINALTCDQNTVFSERIIVSGSNIQGLLRVGPPFMALIDRQGYIYWSVGIPGMYACPYHMSSYFKDHYLSIILTQLTTATIQHYI